MCFDSICAISIFREKNLHLKCQGMCLKCAAFSILSCCLFLLAARSSNYIEGEFLFSKVVLIALWSVIFMLSVTMAFSIAMTMWCFTLFIFKKLFGVVFRGKKIAETSGRLIFSPENRMKTTFWMC